MNRFVKRFMEYRKVLPKGEIPVSANDSASQSNSVTVRQMFSADPAPVRQAASRNFGGCPFLRRRLPGLAGGY